MGVTETRFAAMVADAIARRGQTFTLHGGGTLKAIVDPDYDSIRAKVGIERIEEVRAKGGRVQMLYLTPADEARILKGTSLTDAKGVRWAWEAARNMGADDTDMMAALFCMAGVQE